MEEGIMASTPCFAGATQVPVEQELQQDLKHSLLSPRRKKGWNRKEFGMQVLCHPPKK